MEWANILSGAFVGLAGAVVFADLVLLFVLRAPYLFWHAIRVVAIAFVALAALPLGVQVLNDSSQFLVQGISLDLSLGLIGPLILASVEHRTYSRGWRFALQALLPATLGVAVLLPFFDTIQGLDTVHDSLLGVGLAMVVVALAHGIRRGSLVARYLAAALAPGLSIGAMALVHELTVGGAMPYFYEMIFIALTAEQVIFALGLSVRLGLSQNVTRSLRVQRRSPAREIVIDPETGFLDGASLELRFFEARSTLSRVAMIGFDGIELVDQRLGQEAYSAALETIADAFRSPSLRVTRPSDTEFVLLVDSDQPDALIEKARTRAETSLRDLLHGSDIRVTASASITPIGDDTQLFSIIRRTDRALQRVRDSGGGWTLAVETDGREIQRVEKYRPTHLRAA